MVRTLAFRRNATLVRPNRSHQVAYIVQELIEGGELYEMIEYQGAFDPKFVRYFFSQILKGVLFLHSKGLAHRDLKCSNILLTSQKSIKIVDLGLAKSMVRNGGDVMMHTLAGTIDHMAPEIIESNPYRGAEADLFAVGVILFTLYAGHPPFEKAHRNDKFYRWMFYGQPAEFWKMHDRFHPDGFYDQNFKNLISLMFSYSSQNRPTIPDIIAHPWLRNGAVAT